MKTGEELKHGGRTKKRNHGGKLEAMVEKERHKRKRGGHSPGGHHPKHRPDRHRRSGGATADLNPTTAAGNMSQPEYLKKLPFDNGGGSKNHDSRGLYGRD